MKKFMLIALSNLELTSSGLLIWKPYPLHEWEGFLDRIAQETLE